MPELPEVERFRRILLPLVSFDSNGDNEIDNKKTTKKKKTVGNRIILSLEGSDKPPRKWISQEEIDKVCAGDNYYYCVDVLRKGKLICLRLQPGVKIRRYAKDKYLYLHMGMTGRISAFDQRPMRLQSLKDDEGTLLFPPKYTHLSISAGDYKVAFSDPRKFGAVHLRDDLQLFHELAPDALLMGFQGTNLWSETDSSLVSVLSQKLCDQSLGIKALLLDQKRVLSGVGNWVADEVLYQCNMHPDQSFLTYDEALLLLEKLQHILTTAIDCLTKVDEGSSDDGDSSEYTDFPTDWLFPYRWTRKRAGSKDSQGRTITFIVRWKRSIEFAFRIPAPHSHLRLACLSYPFSTHFRSIWSRPS